MKSEKKASLHSCNVLDAEPASRCLWHFNAANGQVKLANREPLAIQQQPSPKLVVKNWRSLWQRRLNIAWLSAEQVFLRVVHLPASDIGELTSMVELQLEKLSPLPVNQVVWSIELGPRCGENLQTVIVIIAARDVVEEFLGKLEADGFLADRLELPFLNQLVSTPAEDNAVWIRPLHDGLRELCLVAWWCGSTLQQLQLIPLGEGSNPAQSLVEQLTKTAWAGEMEGWLTSRPRCLLVAEPELAASWEAPLRDWAGAPVTVTQPPAKPMVAELSAKRAAQGGTNGNLLPAEHHTRYRQQFIDRLWMSGLGAVLAAYLIGVLVYFGALQVLRFQKHRVEGQVAAVSGDFTNAVRLKARTEVLQNQLNLKFAALDCLRVASERLLGGLTLTMFSFSKGQNLRIEGTAEKEDGEKIIEYNAALRKETVNGELLFDQVEPPTSQSRGQNIFWSFNGVLNHTEIE